MLYSTLFGRMPIVEGLKRKNGGFLMLKVTKNGLPILVIPALVLSMGCTGKSDSERDTAATVLKAVAEMQATEGNQASGTVTFTQAEGGVRVVAQFESVPEGDHGFHIHEFGDCSSGDGKSAGGHYNPGGNPHAGPDAAKRHVGDLGNVTVDASGVVRKEFLDSHLSLEGANSIIGKGVILHADPDDFTSQPTGAAGGRISCGVIKKS